MKKQLTARIEEEVAIGVKIYALKKRIPQEIAIERILRDFLEKENLLEASQASQEVKNV